VEPHNVQAVLRGLGNGGTVRGEDATPGAAADLMHGDAGVGGVHGHGVVVVGSVVAEDETGLAVGGGGGGGSNSATTEPDYAAWGPTVSLAGISADLDGTLLLSFTDDADVESLLGTTIDLFDWNGGLVPGDEFAQVDWPIGFEWDLTDPYLSGNVTLTAVPEPATLTLLVVGLLAARRGR
jgi:hypothetical protein